MSTTHPEREAQPSATPLYAVRDVEDLGELYVRHVSAMTGEGLHSKSAIAAELAFRDHLLQQANARERDLKDELGKRDAELVEAFRLLDVAILKIQRLESEFVEAANADAGRRVRIAEYAERFSDIADAIGLRTGSSPRDVSEAAIAELARCKDLVSERTEQANGFEQALIAQQAENARLAALVDDQGITLAFVHGVLIVIETSPDDFNMEGLREAIKRVARALTNQDAAMRSGGEGASHA